MKASAAFATASRSYPPSTGIGGIGTVTKEEEYRFFAANCLRLHDQVKDTAAKASLLGMARVWHDLAMQAAKNRNADLVYEPAMPTAPLRRTVVQQQQQIQRDKK